MDEVILCPNCGEANPPDLPYCRNCQWRLRSLESEWGTDQGTSATDGSHALSSDASHDAPVPDWLQSSVFQAQPDKSVDEDAAASLRERLDAAGAEEMLAAPSEPRDSEDLLAGLTKAEQSDDEVIPDWVARIMGIADTEESAHTQDTKSARDSDYGHGVQPQESPQTERAAGPLGTTIEIDGQTPWTDSGRSEQQSAPATQPGPNAGGGQSDDIYEWLRQLDANNAAPRTLTSRHDVPATKDVPTWVGRMMGVSADDAADAEAGSSSLPDWLKATESTDDAPPPPRPVPAAIELPAIPPGEPLIPEAEYPAEAPTPPDMTPGLPEPEIDSLDVDAVFAAMDMPQWSRAPGSAEPPALVDAPPAMHDEEAISPAELPSWVQAMRPLESTVAMSEASVSASPRELGGPLLGLQGVLPAIHGTFVSSNRPKPQPWSLVVSEQHRSQALWLEEMLESETRPRPLQGAKRTGGSRLFRWLIAAALLISVVAGLANTSGIFVFPAAVPTETNAAIQIVQQIPEDARVLTVFDYEPATAGEMEAAAASLMDHLLLLKHPRLALVSTSPTGAALAERFVLTTLRERSYSRNVQYADLGYLPGGLAGVQLFAQDPVASLEYGAATDRVWDSPVLQGATALSDFGAIIVLTDSQQAGAVWIEQTTGRRGSTPIVIIASAQAGPLLLPYYDSGQVQGLVSGINGAAGAEIANGGRPGLVRRYWDAYNLGLYFAAALIILGAFWQIVRAGGQRRPEASG